MIHNRAKTLTGFASQKALLGLLSVLMLALSGSWAQAATVAYTVNFFRADQSVALTGTYEIDDSRLQPNLFTPFTDPGFMSLEIPTSGVSVQGLTLTEAPNGAASDLGVITDNSGEVVSFHNSTIGTQLNFAQNGFSLLLRVVEGNGNWFLNDAAAPSRRVAEGPTYTFERAVVPAPAALPLMAAGLGAFGFMGWRRKQAA